MSRVKSTILALLIGAVAVLALAGPAAAQKVGNPGNFNFKLTNGTMKVKDQEFSFDQSQNINFNGTVNAAGAISIPTITFPSYPISASGFNLTVNINVVGPTTGTINPLTGDVSLLLKVWIKIDGVPLGGGCKIASSSSPITLNALITGTSGSVAGTSYNPSNGTMKIVNGNYAVPSSSDCGVAAGTVNDTVGLPSPAGQNTAVFNITTVPAVTRAITPTFTATPTSGTAPATIGFSAAGTTLTAGPATYQWDFQNDGSFDQSGSSNSASFTYTTGGTKTVRLRVTDSQGDYAETTRTVSISAFPDLAISAAGDTDFTVGSNGTYRIDLQNQGYADTGAVTVKSTLPDGLSYVSNTGAGWSCSAAGQDLTCSRSAAVAAHGSAPQLGVVVAVGNQAYDSTEASFKVETSGDSQASNDTASVTTPVRAADLEIEARQVPHALLVGSDPGNVVELLARNVGNAPTSGPIVITDQLPAGATPLWASGTGWSCDISGQTVTCTSTDPVAPGDATPPISIQLDAQLEPGSPGVLLDNPVAVAVAHDVNAANDSVTGKVLILDGPDLAVTKEHVGEFTAGKQGTYRISVENKGPQPTTGGATVTDELPTGLSFVSVDGGPDWQCDQADGTVTCVHAGELAPDESAADIGLVVDVGIAAMPSVSNTASVATGVDPDPDNDESTDTAVVRAIDMKITKTHEGEFRVGQNTVFHLEAENVGDSESIAPTVITDELPAGLSFVSVDGGPDWACQENAGTVSCEHAGLISPGQDVPPVDLTVAVEQAAAPAVTNEATVETASDFNSENDSTSDGGDVIDVDAAITLGRTGTFNPGATGTYLVNVKNIGAVATTDAVEVATTLGQGLEFDGATGNGWSCAEDQGIVTCDGPSGLAGGASAPTLQLRVQVTTAAVPQTTTLAHVTATGDRFTPNDEATDVATVLGPDLSVGSDHQGQFRVGATGTYQLTTANAGPGTTTGPITVVDQLPAGLTFVRAQGTNWTCVNAGQTVTCQRVKPIAPNAAVSPITLEAKVTPAALAPGETTATVDNQVSVSTQSDIDAGNDEATDQTEIVATDLGIELTGPEETGVGGLAEFEATVSSNGAPNVGPAQVELDLPLGFSPRSFTGSGWSCEMSGRRFDCSRADALATDSDAPTLTFVAKVGETAPATAVTQAEVKTSDDVIADNDQATVSTATIARPDLRAELGTTGGGAFVVGQDGSYRAVFRNVGTAQATGPIAASIDLPAGTEFIGLDAGSGWSCTPGTTVECEYNGSIAPGGKAELGFRVTVGRDAGASVTSQVSVTTADDLNSENDEALTTTAVKWIDLALSRSHQAGWVAGGVGAYEVRVDNRGTAATIAPAVVSEVLPGGTEFRSATGDGWSCAVAGRRLTCEGPSAIQPGDSSQFTVTLGLPSGDGGQLEATSTVRTAEDVDPSNDSAQDSIEVGREGSTAPVLPARVTTARARATESGIVLLWVKCPAASGSKCRGRIDLQPVGAVRIAGKKLGRLGSAPFAVAPGRKAPVRIQLKRPGRRALAARKSLKARATVNTKGADATRRVLLIRRAGR